MGTTVKSSIVLAVYIVTMSPLSRKLMMEDAPYVLTSKESEGENDGGFRTFPMVIVTDRVLN